MSIRQIVFIVFMIAGVVGVYNVIIGGRASSPQTVTMTAGSTRTVANGRARLYYAQWSSVPEIEIRCKGERNRVMLGSEPSESACGGVQVRLLRSGQSFAGNTKVELEVTW